MKKSIISYGMKKQGATKEYPFGPEAVVLKVGGKMFALIFEGTEDDFRMNLKCDPVIAENLREQLDAVTPGFHMNKKHWNTVRVDGSLPLSDILDMINHSYDLVVDKLPRNVRESILEMN